MPKISSLSLVRNPENEASAPSVETLRERLRDQVSNAILLADRLAVADGVTYREAERFLRDAVFAFGRALIVLFLALREREVMNAHRSNHPGRWEWLGRVYRVAPPIARNFTTVFGVIRYFRTYMREVAEAERSGFHPLDASLGLNRDRLSWNVLMVAARLATKMAFAEAHSTLAMFMPNAPSTEVIEKTVLGLGEHVADFIEQAPAPEGDGEVLVIQFDGKGAPTATARELARRRRKRKRGPRPTSKRHRGRDKRSRYPRRPRRKKGDKAKNARVATVFVMYTLKRAGTRRLEGPLNVRFYASFANKRHAFTMARRMADKRGFGAGSGKLVHVLTDGDRDLARLCAEYFPDAEHTVDFYHVTEYVHAAGECLMREGSNELADWFDEQRERLLRDQADLIVHELRARLHAMPTTGPGNKGKRQRLKDAIRYIDKRLPYIRYGSLLRRDLDIGTGAVEGAVKRIIGRRCDHGGMRWIEERVEAVVQLRCLELNGQWDAFEAFVHRRLHQLGLGTCQVRRLQTNNAQALPDVLVAA
jgi:hypothetical protein